MKKTDDAWVQESIALSKHCIPTKTAFCVGAIIVGVDGEMIATGYSRETDPKKHAEEIAIEKALQQKIDLTGATIYSSLEPCGKRLSSGKTCTQWIIESGIKRVVFGSYEPSLFVEGNGEELLKQANIETVFLNIENLVM